MIHVARGQNVLVAPVQVGWGKHRDLAALLKKATGLLHRDISVVVCTYHDARWSDLCAALRSLEHQACRPHEIIVVVDYNPQLIERARREFAGVAVVENRQLRGLAGARNSGIAASTGSFVAFLDDDAVAPPEWLALLAEGYEHADVAGIGGSIEPVWEDRRPAWFPSEFDWVIGCSHPGMPGETQEVRNLIGCNMSFRRDLLASLGGFRIGPYCDETELCIRLRRRWPDMKLVYRPEACVLHRVPRDRARFGYFLRRCYTEGRLKAVVSGLAGSSEGLATERWYVRRVLPRAFRKELAQFASGSDGASIARAAVMVAGLATTTAAYAVTRPFSGTWLARVGRPPRPEPADG